MASQYTFAIARKWRSLADRRLLYMKELYRSNRWTTNYPTEREFAEKMLRASGRIMRIILILLAACAATALRPAIAANKLAHGKALLQRDCAHCHAIGKTGESPRKDAPAFRTLGRRYPIESLEESLGEGIITGHNDMPEFKFSSADVGTIIAYLKSIQQH